MEVIVITTSGKNDVEINRINRLFEAGLDTLHLRKPKLSRSEIEGIIESIPAQYHNRIVIHGRYDLARKFKLKGVHLKRRHRSDTWKNKWRRFKLRLFSPGLVISTTFHSIQSLKENQVKYDYVLLSNVFSAHSRYNYEDSGMKLLRSVIETSGMKVFAVGGVKEEKMGIIQTAGFHGVGLSSAVLNEENENFMKDFRHFEAA